MDAALFTVELDRHRRYLIRIAQLQLRAEAFNVFNHTNFKTIASTNVTSAVLGQISATRDPRTVQLGAKFIF